MYYSSSCVFSGVCHIFSSLHLVLRGREDVAYAVSRPSSLCSNFGTQKRAVLQSPSSIRFSLNHRRRLYVFGRRDQCSRRACRHQAGSGSASQVKVGTEELETVS